jgi:hypothetical protein
MLKYDGIGKVKLSWLRRLFLILLIPKAIIVGIIWGPFAVVYEMFSLYWTLPKKFDPNRVLEIYKGFDKIDGTPTLKIK